MWPERWEPAGPPPAVPPYVDLSPPVLYWFYFIQVKNTRRMRCWRWHEIKEKEEKGRRGREGGGGKKEKSISVSNLWVGSWVHSRHYQEVTVQRVSSKEKKKRGRERWSGDEERGREGASVIFYLKISFLFSPFTLCAPNGFRGWLGGKCISFDVIVQFLP